MLCSNDRLCVETIKKLIAEHTDEEILYHYKKLGYSMPATADMIKRCKIKQGLLPRIGFQNNPIRSWTRQGGIADAVRKF